MVCLGYLGKEKTLGLQLKRHPVPHIINELLQP
jgi:hypothetical protein